METNTETPVVQEKKITFKKVEGNQLSMAEKEKAVLETHAAETSPEKPVEKPVETPVAEVELKDEQVFEFLGKKFNKTVTSFDDITKEVIKEPELPEDVKTFLKYKTETGRGIDDFIKVTKDYDKIPADDIIREYLSIKEEGLDSEDISALMKDFEIDEDIDDEASVRTKKLNKKKTFNEAKKFFDTQKETYKIPLVSSGLSVSEDEKTDFESYKQYIAKLSELQQEDRLKGETFEKKTTDLFNPAFKGFEFNITDDNNKVVKTIVFAPGNPDELKKKQSTPQNFIKKFVDDKGFLTDEKGYHRGLSMAMNPEAYAKYFYEQGLSDAKEGVIGGIKNINMSQRNAPQSLPKGLRVIKVGSDVPSGNGLKIQSAKKIN